MNAPDILIYDDLIHNHGTLYRALAAYFGAPRVGFTDARAIIDGGLTANIRLLVMPGGADLYFCEKLNGVGNAQIRAFVEAGGAYLGLCAGAYYGSAAIFWAEDSDQPICGDRELGFFDGTATGPVYAWLEQGRIDHSWHAAPLIAYDDGSQRLDLRVCYEGGPVFSESPHAQILARYSELPGAPPAIVERRIGMGRAILSSPHIERIMPTAYNRLYETNNHSYAHDKRVYESLSPYAEKQKTLWSSILSRLAP